MPLAAAAAPYAALVMDARTGEVLYSTNADTRLHPASLTKMLTLYITFEAIAHGEISLDTMVTVSANAASEPPSKLGLRKGQKIALRYLIRAAAIKSANDAATAIGEAIGGSEAAFAARMNRTAKALGMKNSTFKNANGLTATGHLSTARDMTLLGRRLFYDFPEYYNLFSRRSADAGGTSVHNTNARFLDAYEGADGIKTGYTGPAGFNLTASALRGNKRIIATVLGGTSTLQRNAKMAELLNLGFSKAPNRVQESRPAPLVYLADAPAEGAGKIVRVSGAVRASPRPVPRPGPAAPPEPAPVLLAAAEPVSVADLPAAGPVFAQSEAAQPETLALVTEPATEAPPAALVPDPEGQALAAAEPAADVVFAATSLAVASSPRPLRAPGRSPAVAPAAAPAFAQSEPPQPETVALTVADAAPDETPAISFVASSTPQPETLALVTEPVLAPVPRPERLILATLTPEAPAPLEAPEVVARVSTSGGQHWGISLGKFNTSYQAERALLQTALMEAETLGDALRKVNPRRGAFEANFVGMPRDLAEMACRRLTARTTDCAVIGP
ncbi:MAG: serine hydrolase [Pseudorhodobacter sp.]|nr:serine hydrolase [Pseudorhodobacter sp.]